MNRRQLLCAGAALGVGYLMPVRAQGTTKIVLGYTAVSDFTAAFVAREQGFFRKRNLDVEPLLIPLNPSIPPALQSGSIQVGGPTPPVMIQAVDSGLDLVAIAGGSVTSKTATNYGLVPRTGVTIRNAQDCVGKKIGVPGIGAFLHVLFRKWLADNGVDPKRVNFVETAFPQHSDVLKAGSVDAVVTADPFMSRILQAGTGQSPIHYAQTLPEGMPAILYATTREWAMRNAAAVRGFREAIAEGVEFTNRNQAAARADMGKYIKVPPEVLATMHISTLKAELDESQMRFWVDVMKAQDMLKGSPDPAKLLFR